MLAKYMGLSTKQVNEMPFYKVLLYAHAIQVMEGTDTRWMHSDANTPKITLDNINKYLEEI